MVMVFVVIRLRFRRVKTLDVVLVVVGVECVGDLQLLVALAPPQLPTFKVCTLHPSLCLSMIKFHTLYSLIVVSF